MATTQLDGIRVAILVAPGFEWVELISPREALEQAGARVDVVSPAENRVRGWNRTDWGAEVDVDVPLDDARAGDYDALLLPGGLMSPDRLRTDRQALDFVHEFFEEGKPVAAICHGPWTLIDAGVVKGRTLTSYPSIRADLTNAGANWVDEEVVVDLGLVTSRKPADLPAFNRAIVAEFSKNIVDKHRTRVS